MRGLHWAISAEHLMTDARQHAIIAIIGMTVFSVVAHAVHTVHLPPGGGAEHGTPNSTHEKCFARFVDGRGDPKHVVAYVNEAKAPVTPDNCTTPLPFGTVTKIKAYTEGGAPLLISAPHGSPGMTVTLDTREGREVVITVLRPLSGTQ
jgi:hypothetical protein